MKALGGPSAKCMLSAGRKTDGRAVGRAGGVFLRGGGEETAGSIVSPCVSWASWRKRPSLRWLPFTPQFGLLWSAEQGPGPSPRKCCSTESAYTFTNRVSVSNTCHCVQMWGNRAFCRIIPVQFVKYVVCTADVCSLGSMYLYSSSHLQSCGQTCFGGLEGRMAVYIKWWCCNIVHVTKDREVTLPWPMENFGFF